MGFALWLAVYESGVHATIAGVVMGLLTPARPIQTELEAEQIVDVLEGRRMFVPTMSRDRNADPRIGLGVRSAHRRAPSVDELRDRARVRARQRRHRPVGRRHLGSVGGAHRRRRRRSSSASSSVSHRSAGSPSGSDSAASPRVSAGDTSSAWPRSPGSGSRSRCSSPAWRSTRRASRTTPRSARSIASVVAAISRRDLVLVVTARRTRRDGGRRHERSRRHASCVGRQPVAASAERERDGGEQEGRLGL